MEIKVDDVVVFTIENWHRKVLEDEMDEKQVDADIIRRLVWFLNHIFENKVKLKTEEWKNLLKENNVKSVPLNSKDFVESVVSQPNYKNFTAKERENE